MMKNEQVFNGFYHETIQFMFGLSMNNYKSWFEEHRFEYEQYLLTPMKNLVMALTETMLSIDAQFETSPRVDKTISRIYRDIRFSQDKSPYRSNMWITFKRPVPDWKDYPCFFFELMLEGYRYGMGYYSASVATMNQFRKKVDAEPAVFLNIIEPIHDHFSVEGNNYKRPFPGIRDQKIDLYYNKKSFYLTRNHELEEMIFSGKLVDEIIMNLPRLKKLYDYLLLIS